MKAVARSVLFLFVAYYTAMMVNGYHGIGTVFVAAVIGFCAAFGWKD